jgi:membrane protease YdiL (CAAX protease family)
LTTQLAALAITSVVTVALVAVARPYRGKPAWGPITHAALTAWAVALPFLVPSALGLPSLTAITVLRAALVGIGLYAVTLALTLGFPRFSRRSTTFITLARHATTAPLRTFVVMAIVAPVLEEYVFRGFLFNLFIRWGVVSAVVATSLLFVLSHRDRAGAALFAIAGVAFALLRINGDGVALPIIAHAVANVCAFTTFVQLKRLAPWLVDQPGESGSRAVAPEST